MKAGEIYIRTEDIKQEAILSMVVRTPTDQDVIDYLKDRSPILLKGSRGSGKSFLLRTAEAELLREFKLLRVLPVYVSFMTTPLIRVNAEGQFVAWMIATIASEIIRAAQTMGLVIPHTGALKAIGGDSPPSVRSRMEIIQAEFENSWKKPLNPESVNEVPEVGLLVDAARDLCRGAGLERINLLVDEAAQVFIPEQQRQFFGLMRDLRSPYIAVKAAVYPGATSFGISFQPGHDATVISIDRSIADHGYIRSMREMLYKQDKNWIKLIEPHGEIFDTLAYAATGNPRMLLTTMRDSTPLGRANCDRAIRQYYRETVWRELNDLAGRYPGHRKVIDWAAAFLRNEVLNELNKRHYRRPGVLYDLWIHRDSPELVREALQLLCYNGILQEGTQAVKARSGVGNRYTISLGCQFAMASEPSKFGLEARSGLGSREYLEFGQDHSAFASVGILDSIGSDPSSNQVLEARLKAPISELELSNFQRSKLVELNLRTIGDVLEAGEETFRRAKGIGIVRARQMKNAAVAAVLEYLSG